MIRCSWVNDNPLYIKYHDEEWGVASYEDKYLYLYKQNLFIN